MGIGERGPMVAILVGGAGTRINSVIGAATIRSIPRRVRGDRDSGMVLDHGGQQDKIKLVDY